MGSITKRGKKYYARVRVVKNYIASSEGKSFENKLDALMWIETRECEILTGAEKDYDEGKTLGDVMSRKWLRPKKEQKMNVIALMLL